MNKIRRKINNNTVLSLRYFIKYYKSGISESYLNNIIYLSIQYCLLNSKVKISIGFFERFQIELFCFRGGRNIRRVKKLLKQAFTYIFKDKFYYVPNHLQKVAYKNYKEIGDTNNVPITFSLKKYYTKELITLAGKKLVKEIEVLHSKYIGKNNTLKKIYVNKACLVPVDFIEEQKNNDEDEFILYIESISSHTCELENYCSMKIYYSVIGDKTIFSILLPHALIDGWSLSKLVEIFASYLNYDESQSRNIIGFSVFALIQNYIRSTEDYAERLKKYSSDLIKNSKTINLSTIFKNKNFDQGQPSHFREDIPKKYLKEAISYAKKHKMTLHSVFFSFVYMALLDTVNTRSLPVRYAVANRSPGFDSVIGCITNSLIFTYAPPKRCSITIESIHRRLIDLYKFQDIMISDCKATCCAEIQDIEDYVEISFGLNFGDTNYDEKPSRELSQVNFYYIHGTRRPPLRFSINLSQSSNFIICSYLKNCVSSSVVNNIINKFFNLLQEAFLK